MYAIRSYYANLPFHFRVIRLEFLVGNRPIREAGVGNSSQQRPLVEIHRPETPVIRGEMIAAATDDSCVKEGVEVTHALGRIARPPTKSLRTA